jgi:hypothetical protein
LKQIATEISLAIAMMNMMKSFTMAAAMVTASDLISRLTKSTTASHTSCECQINSEFLAFWQRQSCITPAYYLQQLRSKRRRRNLTFRAGL